MRRRWRRLVAALLAVGSLAAGLAAVALGQAAIQITTLEARASGAALTSGPNAAGFDVFIAATVSETSWSSTRVTIGGVSKCVNHENQRAGDRTLTIRYAFDNAVLREGRAARIDAPGARTQVFPPPRAAPPSSRSSSSATTAALGPRSRADRWRSRREFPATTSR